MKKLHLACGDIYLKGYENVDIGGILSKECSRKELNKNKTTLNKYFKYSFGSPRRNIIVDKKMNLLDIWSYKENSIDEIVMISCIEHFSKKDADFIISEVKRVLKSGGKFIVDFPDLKEQFLKYYEKDPEFYMELVYCNHKNQYSIHHWGYTEDTFKKALGDSFSCVKKTVVKHDYPMIGIVATKR